MNNQRMLSTDPSKRHPRSRIERMPRVMPQQTTDRLTQLHRITTCPLIHRLGHHTMPPQPVVHTLATIKSVRPKLPVNAVHELLHQHQTVRSRLTFPRFSTSHHSPSLHADAADGETASSRRAYTGKDASHSGGPSTR